jgi:hypothetical protein
MKLFSVLVALVVLISTLSVNQTFAEEDYLDYENFDNGFTIQYPSDWEKIVPDDPFLNVMFISPAENDDDLVFENALVGVENTSPNMTLEAYTKLTKGSIISANVQVIESRDIVLSGQTFHKFMYIEKGFADIQYLGVWTIKNSKAYFMVFTASPETFSKYDKTFDKILNSFQVTSETPQEEIGIENIPTEITGKYHDSETGLEIDFPKDWSGIKMKQNNISMAFATSGISTKLFSSEVDPNFSMIMVMSGDLEDMNSLGSKPECSVPPTGTILNLGQMKTIEIVGTCMEPSFGVELRMLAYTFATNDDMVLVIYNAGSDSAYDRDLSKFEESLQTLQLTNTIDISDPLNYAKMFNYDLKKEIISIDSKTHEISIIGNVTISDFSFYEKEKEMSFGINENKGLGVTELFVGDVLEEPYTVKIDGMIKNDFSITTDQTSDNVIISFDYELPVQEIIVSGKVVSTSGVPDWVRNNAEWWSQGAIGDSDFVSGIQFLIKEGILQIPETAQPASEGSEEIPEWIKNNADWWSQGLISDDDFLKGIQFLVENGIIKV